MNQSLQWSLLASAALALLLMAPISTRRDGKPTATLATIAAKRVQESWQVLRDARPEQHEHSEAAAVSLVLAGCAGAWLVRRHSSASSH